MNNYKKGLVICGLAALGTAAYYFNPNKKTVTKAQAVQTVPVTQSVLVPEPDTTKIDTVPGHILAMSFEKQKNSFFVVTDGHDTLELNPKVHLTFSSPYTSGEVTRMWQDNNEPDVFIMGEDKNHEPSGSLWHHHKPYRAGNMNKIQFFKHYTQLQVTPYRQEGKAPLQWFPAKTPMDIYKGLEQAAPGIFTP